MTTNVIGSKIPNSLAVTRQLNFKRKPTDNHSPTSSICTPTQTTKKLKMVCQVRHPAPDFTGIAAVNGELKKISLSQYKGKFVVLVFFPLAYTFVCPTEIIAFSERAEEFRKLGAELIACSVDSEYTLLSWTNVPRQQGGLGAINIPLLSDLTHKISRDYGKTVAITSRTGVFLDDAGHTLRGNVVIDPKGIVRVIVHHDLPIGRNVDEMIRVIEAIKFTDEHGEVCPINWKKGDSTIKPDPKNKLEYFSKAK